MIRWFKFSAFLAIAATGRGAERAAETEVYAQGFKLNVFAEPFDIGYPTALAAGADGTIYLSQDPNGSLGHGRQGAIRACKDTDGDGVADKFWDYVPQVKWPRGGHMVGEKFYLIHPPYLSVFEDLDGDGVADSQTRLVDGLGESQNDQRGADHTTNGVRMGIDGWLYIAVGDFGMTNSTGTDGRTITLRGGGVARVRPDGTELEIYSYHTRNHCDVAIDPYLDMFVRDNTNDGKGWNIRLHHFTNLSEHGYPRLYQNFADEAVKPLLDLGGGSGTGALYLHEPGLPEGYGDRLLTCDWTTGKIYEHGLERHEASFRATEKEFMNVTRVVDVDVDGQSVLYTADWRGGNFKYEGDGKPVGLIHRIVPEGGVQVEEFPNLEELSDEDLVSQISHRSAVRRLEVQAEILQRGPQQVFAESLASTVVGEAPLYGKVAAIFTYKQLYEAAANPLLAEWTKIAEVREFALRALADRRTQTDGIAHSVWEAALEDENPRVRLQASIGIERCGASPLASQLIESAAQPWAARSELTEQEDFRFPHTAIQVLGHLRAREACLAAAEVAETREVAFAGLKLMAGDEQAVNGLVELLTNSGEDARLRMQVMAVLVRLAHQEEKWNGKDWWSTRPDDRGPYFAPETWSSTPLVIKALEEGFARLEDSQQEEMLEVFAQGRLNVLEMNLGDLDSVRVAMGMSILQKGQVTILTEAALDEKRSWEQRLKAFRKVAALTPDKFSGGDFQMPLSAVVRILSSWAQEAGLEDKAEQELSGFINSPDLMRYRWTLRKIARQAVPEESRVAWRALFALSQSALVKERLRAQVMKMALSNPMEVGYYLALAEVKLPGFEKPIEAALNADNRKLIDAAQRAKDAIEEALAAEGGDKLVGESSLEEVMQAVLKGGRLGPGDIVRGKASFQKAACASCHAVSLEEVQKGPYLGTAGSQFERQYLIESILEPGKVVAQGFRTVQVSLKDGSSHLGFITREEDGEVDVRDLGGRVTTLQESEIEKRTEQPISMMPPGLTSGLTVEEFTSLIDYLMSME